MTDHTITLERRLISQELRSLFSRMRAGTFTAADPDRLLELVTVLANGDTAAAEAALQCLISKPNPTLLPLLRLFDQGRVDVVGVRNGQLEFFVTSSEQEAFKNN